MPNRHATLTSLFEDVADAIRSKTGDTAEIKADDFDTAIEAISTGGGLPDEAFPQLNTDGVTTASALGGVSGGILTKYFAPQINRLMFPAILNNCTQLFLANPNQDLSSLNVTTGEQYTAGSVTFESMFQNCTHLRNTPKITVNGASFTNINIKGMFAACNNLRYIADDLLTIDETKMQLANNNIGNVFAGCSSLRQVPAFLYTVVKFNNSSTGGNYYLGTFQNCYVLDEILNLPVPTATITSQASNIFYTAFQTCARLKRLTFETNEDGTPKTLNVNGNFTIELNTLGYNASQAYFTNYNSGISQTKKVSNQESYDLLKNDPDWFSTTEAYSRYNHDSAVETINSLPIVSGGVGTIKFKRNAGSATDGGAIGNLTNAEIAVATNKGWTVTLI